jgi:hypothetical protein
MAWLLSPAQAFAAHGVTLRFPARSLSGVRSEDGVVLFAVRADDVRTDADGSSTPLWTPARAALDRASSDERLEHCRLAMRQGGAEGFVLNRAPRDERCAFALRVVRAGHEYWARWGSVARAEQPPRYAPRAVALAR